MSLPLTGESAGQTHPSGGSWRAFLKLVAIEHSVFALPFAYLAALTAMHRSAGRVNWWDLLLITVAMVGARTFAMAANRVIDRVREDSPARAEEAAMLDAQLHLRLREHDLVRTVARVATLLRQEGS